jgi:pimeloyl-ACP methyl ester carboxylesterase
MAFFVHDSIKFHYLERGEGLPFVFQHGLGGDAEAIFALLSPRLNAKLICLDCRAHGKTTPLGPTEKFAFSTFADDLLALLDVLELREVVVGGSSMGAGVALNFALRHRQRVRGLVLQRPAWLDVPNPFNLQVFDSVARHIREYGPQAGVEEFKKTELYRSIAAASIDSANSLLSQFTHPRALETLTRLERIPRDAPNRDKTRWRELHMPVLVMANRVDPIHPFDFGQTFAREIPGAEFRELTPKSVDVARFTSDVNLFLADFLRLHFVLQPTTTESQC